MKALVLALLLLAACAEVNTMDTVVIETSKGTIEVELSEQAPETAANFLSYVDAGAYDGTVFHRVIPGFMIQGGGFNPDGSQRDRNAPVRLEAGLPNHRGTIAMARTPDPDSATNQFFINVADNAFLNPAPGNPGYAVFGKVTSGMDVADAIVGVQTRTRNGMADWPTEDVVITKTYRK